VRRALSENPVVRGGVLAWALIGFVVAIVVAAVVLFQLRLVIVPLVLAVFPAALLAPPVARARRRLPDAAAVVAVLVPFLVALVGVVGFAGWLIAGELTELVETMEGSYAETRDWAEDTFDVDMPAFGELTERAQGWATAEGGIRSRATDAATTTLEVLAATLFGVVALFFYLKDGGRIAAWLRDLFPTDARPHVEEVGRRSWITLGAYFRGQLLVAAVDAVFIGLGLFILGVPLALPLAILVLIGGLFPVVGAFVAGALAVLVALADGGVVLALSVVALNLAVQQLEGNVLQPIIVGRATALHPLAVIVAITAGGFVFGILGAFLAVPLTAVAARAVGYLRTDLRDPGAEALDRGEVPTVAEADPTSEA
jgi:predicted PurR-regulated permease PerM